MAPSQIVTETILLQLQEAVNLEASGSPAAEAFAQLTKTVKAQRGFRSQYWGSQVENPNVFVWFIDWETFEDIVAFVKSKEHQPFMANLGQVFDFEKAAPLITFTRFDPEEAAAALKAGVTEVSYFTLPNGSEENKNAVLEALAPVNDLVKNIGKATGSTMAWVFEDKQGAAELRQPGEALLCGIFGYESIEVHMKWNKQAEAGRPAEIFAELVENNLVLQSATAIPGIEPEVPFFHVHFHTGT